MQVFIGVLVADLLVSFGDEDWAALERQADIEGIPVRDLIERLAKAGLDQVADMIHDKAPVIDITKYK